MRVQSFSFAGQNFQVETLDCSTGPSILPTTICDTLEISIASEVYASINNTLNLLIDKHIKVATDELLCLKNEGTLHCCRLQAVDSPITVKNFVTVYTAFN
jgi:hypothetical protein